jgi:stage V sporulation protein G
VEITEVRIKLMAEGNDKLRAFCSITIDNDFVVRDLKVIEGSRGPFVAMPSRKLTERCPRCKSKNHYRAFYCNDCGNRLSRGNSHGSSHGGSSHGGSSHDSAPHARGFHDSARGRFHDSDRGSHDSPRVKLHADIAHPINSRCRELIQARILEGYYAELERAKDPNYHPVDLDVFDEDSLAEEAGEMVSLVDAGSTVAPSSASEPALDLDGFASELETSREVGAETDGVWSGGSRSSHDSARGSSHGGSSHDSAPPARGPHDSAPGSSHDSAPARASHDPARGRGYGPRNPGDSRHPRFSRGPADRDRPPGRRDGGRGSSHGSAPSARGSHDPARGPHDRFRGFQDRGRGSHGSSHGGSSHDSAPGSSHDSAPTRGTHDPARSSHDPARRSHDHSRAGRDDLELLHERVPEPKKPMKEVESESEDNFGVGLFS